MADGKAIPVSPSALIPVGGRNFSGMQSVNDLRSLQAAAAGHSSLDPTSILRKDAEAQSTVYVPPRQQGSSSKQSIVGTKIRDRKTGRKGIVIQARAGYTKKTNTPVHKAADKAGNTWLVKQSDIELL